MPFFQGLFAEPSVVAAFGVLLALTLATWFALGRYRAHRSLRQARADTDRMVEELRRDAFHDPLTTLPNRALFMDRLERALERSERRQDSLFAVLSLDLDRFKLINDSLGHTFGDDVLAVVGARLREAVDPVHTVARLGGDEFAVLAEEVAYPGDGVRIAETITEALEQPVVLGEEELFVTASVGVALAAGRYRRAEDLLRDAEIAMYRAKATGGASHQVFDRTMHQRAVAMLKLESDLRRAVRREELAVAFQPIVSLPDARVVGFEALLRWRHPERGVVPPEQFVPIAEETGLIVPLGHWVLRAACRQVREWRERFPHLGEATVAVNLSSRQLARADLVDEVAATLEEHALPGSALRLELTESTLMERSELAEGLLHRLKELDVRLSIDDFGTGYSSLSYLHRFPLDTIKVDRSFVGRIPNDRENLEITRTIVALAHELSMDVVAEGVETREQARVLTELGCEYAQGWLFAPPEEAAQVSRRLGRVRPSRTPS